MPEVNFSLVAVIAETRAQDLSEVEVTTNKVPGVKPGAWVEG